MLVSDRDETAKTISGTCVWFNSAIYVRWSEMQYKWSSHENRLSMSSIFILFHYLFRTLVIILGLQWENIIPIDVLYTN